MGPGQLEPDLVKSWRSEPDSSVDWMALVAKVKGDDPKGGDELHRVFSRGVHFFLSRRFGLQQLEARVRKTFTSLVSAIRTEDLRHHESLVGLVRAVVLQQITACADGDVVLDRPDEKAIHSQHVSVMVKVLRSLFLRDQEALTRFYCHEQTQERICNDLQLSETQLLLIKTRAKDSFARALAGQRVRVRAT